MIKIMTDGFFSYPAEILQKPLTSRKALSEIKPLGKSSVWFESQIAYAKLLQKKYGSEVPLFYNVFAVPRTIEFMQRDSRKPDRPWRMGEGRAGNAHKGNGHHFH